MAKTKNAYKVGINANSRRNPSFSNIKSSSFPPLSSFRNSSKIIDLIESGTIRRILIADDILKTKFPLRIHATTIGALQRQSEIYILREAVKAETYAIRKIWL